MAIQVPCPKCTRVTHLPDSAGGAIGRCKHCGRIIKVPIAMSQRKYCSVCHADVSQAKRVKDPEGAYYCPACWAARLDANAATGDDFWNALEDLDKK